MKLGIIGPKCSGPDVSQLTGIYCNTKWTSELTSVPLMMTVAAETYVGLIEQKYESKSALVV